jgi:hypothetical protein
VSYKASAVKIYNATSSLVRFENKNIFFLLKNALAYYNAGVVAVNLKGVGLAPGSDLSILSFFGANTYVCTLGNRRIGFSF